MSSGKQISTAFGFKKRRTVPTVRFTLTTFNSTSSLPRRPLFLRKCHPRRLNCRHLQKRKHRQRRQFKSPTKKMTAWFIGLLARSSSSSHCLVASCYYFGGAE